MDQFYFTMFLTFIFSLSKLVRILCKYRLKMRQERKPVVKSEIRFMLTVAFLFNYKSMC